MGNKGEVGHPSDVTDEEWEFALPYLLLSRACLMIASIFKQLA